MRGISSLVTMVNKLRRRFQIYSLKDHIRDDMLMGSEVSLTVNGEVRYYRPIVYLEESIDYCFASNFDLNQTLNLKVGGDEWIEQQQQEFKGEGFGIFSVLNQKQSIIDKAVCLTKSEIFVVPAGLPITQEIELEIRIAERMEKRIKFVSHWEQENNFDTLDFLISRRYGLFSGSRDLFFCGNSRDLEKTRG